MFQGAAVQSNQDVVRSRNRDEKHSHANSSDMFSTKLDEQKVHDAVYSAAQKIVKSRNARATSNNTDIDILIHEAD